MSAPEKRFDLDLARGQAGENWVRWLGDLPAAKVEVKRECSAWMDTGNLAFEFECNGVPSGVAATTSDFWIHLLDREGLIIGGFIFRREPLLVGLRVGVREKRFPVVEGGDRGAVKMVLVPIRDVGQLMASE